MKNFIILLFCMVAFTFGANTFFASGEDVGFHPVDIKVYDLFDTVIDTTDTVATTEYFVIGPYPMTSSTNSPQYKALTFMSGALAAGDSLQAYYQFTMHPVITDTVSGGWILADTLTISGSQRDYVDISDEVGVYAWFKFYNFTAGDVIVREIDAVLRKNLTYYKKQ